MNELTKQETKILKGIAILFMVGLHLYNRVELEGFYSPLIWMNGYPLIYYLSFLFDACVPIYCFCSGYAMYLMKNKPFKYHLKRLFLLMINYWIVLIVTCLLGLLFNNVNIPKDIITFILNVSLIRISYVGAWWFMQTYVLLILSSKSLNNLVDKLNNAIILLVGLVIYFIAYYFRMINPIVVNNVVLQTIINAILLYGTSVFPFIVGGIFRKNIIISKVRNQFDKHHQIIGFLLIFICMILHVVVKSMIVAPFIGILFIIGYSLINFNEFVKKVLLFLGEHSTNIWLMHMQFYMIFFSDIVFNTNTVIGCLIILVGMCLISSFAINWIDQIIHKLIKRSKNVFRL